MAKRRRLPATAKKTSKNAKAPKPARARKLDGTVITIRAMVGEPGRQTLLKVSLKNRPQLARIAEEWTYILRSRTRWADDMSIRPLFRDRALADLDTIGLSRTLVKQLSTTRHVEVELHRWDASDEAAQRRTRVCRRHSLGILDQLRDARRRTPSIVAGHAPLPQRGADIYPGAGQRALHRKRPRPARGCVRLRVGARTHPRGGRRRPQTTPRLPTRRSGR